MPSLIRYLPLYDKVMYVAGGILLKLLQLLIKAMGRQNSWNIYYKVDKLLGINDTVLCTK